MNILAIDPGPTESAMVHYLDCSQPSLRICNHVKASNRNLLNELAGFSASLKTSYSLVIEKIASYGMSVGEDVFETCVWTGRFIQAWGGEEGVNWHRLTRHQIKMHLCHTAKAKDSNIRQALIDRLGPPGRKASPGPTFGISGDCWSALAVAVTFADLQSAHTSIGRGEGR